MKGQILNRSVGKPVLRVTCESPQHGKQYEGRCSRGAAERAVGGTPRTRGTRCIFQLVGSPCCAAGISADETTAWPDVPHFAVKISLSHKETPFSPPFSFTAFKPGSPNHPCIIRWSCPAFPNSHPQQIRMEGS